MGAAEDVVLDRAEARYDVDVRDRGPSAKSGIRAIPMTFESISPATFLSTISNTVQRIRVNNFVFLDEKLRSVGPRTRCGCALSAASSLVCMHSGERITHPWTMTAIILFVKFDRF